VEDYDVLVVGGTPAGCCAAVAAARRGLKVCILEPTQELGGLTANGIGVCDTGTLQSLNGIFAEYVQRVRDWYRDRGVTDRPRSTRTEYWEAHVAAAIWSALVEEAGDVTVILGAVALGAETEGARITAVRFERTNHPMGDLPDAPGAQESVAGRVVIDATYEGDVAAWAGASFRIGREGRSAEEPHAGVIYTAYMAREPVEGFLPQTILPASTGEADDLVMAFNCRLICKLYDDTSEGARHRVPAPKGYDPSRYRYQVPAERELRRLGTRNPGGKFDMNRVFFGNDLSEIGAQYVLAHPRERGALRRRYIDHALGFLHYVQTDGGAPEIGLADDEFTDNNNIPHQIYVREGRRIEGVTTISEQNTNPFLAGTGYRPPLLRDSVALADFEMDTKIHRNLPDEGHELPEGAFFLRQLRCPVQIPYGCIVPRRLENLLVPVALSATHVAYSVIRMEPAWANLGHAAGIAAAIMAAEERAASAVPVRRLQDELIRDKGKPVFFSDLEADHPDFASVQRLALRGFVPHDRALRFRPEEPITRAELCEATVRAFGLPISVTGAHFHDVPPEHPGFRWAETIYDLSTRNNVPIIPGSFPPVPDSFVELHRRDATAPWQLEFGPDSPLEVSGLEAFLSAAAKAVQADTGRNTAPLTSRSATRAGGLASRALACRLLDELTAGSGE
jgi:hypothetical protein